MVFEAVEEMFEVVEVAFEVEEEVNFDDGGPAVRVRGGRLWAQHVNRAGDAQQQRSIVAATERGNGVSRVERQPKWC